MRVEVQPLVSPEYLHRVTGVRYDERFFGDPEYRSQQNEKLAEASAALVPPDFRAGLPPGFWSTDTLAIGVGQSFLLIAGLFGSRFQYEDNYFPNATSRPLEDWSLDQIACLEPPDVANTWPLSEYLAQYDDLVARYGIDRVALPGFVSKLDTFHAGQFLAGVCHSPITQALRLRGQQLFYDMVDAPGIAKHLLDVVVETECRCMDLMARRIGARPGMVYQLCCSAALLSRDVFEAWELPAMLGLFEQYGVKNRIHSCGISSQLLHGLALIPELLELELGEGTDMVAARQLWPEACLVYCIDSPTLPTRTVASIQAGIRKVIAAAGSGPLTIQVVYEEGLQLDQFHAVYDVVREHNARDRDSGGRAVRASTTPSDLTDRSRNP